jgi:hypothetical protein
MACFSWQWLDGPPHTQCPQSNNGRHGKQRGDKAVLDHGGAVFVFQKNFLIMTLIMTPASPNLNK